jgi:hypothetical protein
MLSIEQLLHRIVERDTARLAHGGFDVISMTGSAGYS